MFGNITLKDVYYWQKAYHFAMPINGMLSLLSTILAVYMILYKSSVQIQTYKWYLLNIVAWAFIADCYLSVLYVPIIATLGKAIASSGALQTLTSYMAKRIELIICICLTCGLATSIVSAFLYRLAAITQNIDTLQTKLVKSVIVAVHFLYGTPLYIFVILDDVFDYSKSVKEDTELFRRYQHRNLNTQNMYFFTHDFLIMPFECFIVLLILIFIISCVGLAFVIIKKSRVDKAKMSTRTMILHRQFTYSLLVQAFLPIILIVIPFIIFATLLIFNQFNGFSVQLLSYFLFFVASLHSTFNSISMLIMIEPYRRTILKKLPGFCRFKKTSVVVMMDANKPADQQHSPENGQSP